MADNTTMSAASMVGTLSSAYSQYELGKTRRIISKSNERLAKLRAEDALKRGQKREGASRGQYKKLLGKQRAAMAAQGIDIQSGSAQDIQEETQVVSELDALTIKLNAAREAFGYESQGRGFGMEGILEQQEGSARSTQTLLTGGLRAYELYKQT
jgi:hypothetical protein